MLQNSEKHKVSESFSGLQKGPAGRGHVKKRQKSSKSVKNIFRHFSTIFAQGKKRQKSSKSAKNVKIVKKRQKVFRHFSTIFARRHFSGPFWGALRVIFIRISYQREIWCQRVVLEPVTLVVSHGHLARVHSAKTKRGRRQGDGTKKCHDNLRQTSRHPKSEEF